MILLPIAEHHERTAGQRFEIETPAFLQRLTADDGDSRGVRIVQILVKKNVTGEGQPSTFGRMKVLVGQIHVTSDGAAVTRAHFVQALMIVYV